MEWDSWQPMPFETGMRPDYLGIRKCRLNVYFRGNSGHLGLRASGPLLTQRWGNRPAFLLIGEDWVLRFRLMVKRGHRGYGPQASEGEAQHGLFCGTRRFGQGYQRLHCG